ncbi:uncharacterized protein LOC131253691 [Magnolia sinica]|uniref:uncharacterized protein LOC131253691 n=1 Tax=Magnolia sinica TaxID=86752 RepID=UPI0026583572|nr:uncharacterized protein LOC131253691 [Magnolia sinica]
MEAIKEQSPTPVPSSGSKLRYPLRSANRSKVEKSAAMPEIPTSSASKRRAASNVSKSVSVLDLSGKDKSAKPPRRLSIPAKSAVSPLPRTVGGVTPISETRIKKPANNQGKSETLLSDVSKLANRKKFSVLSSASYWISQIKLSESASKHSISLGFFKLALECGCEPLQRMRDELKSYARRHNLLELGEPAKEVFESYNVLEDLEQLQASETCSQVPESSDGESNASSTTKAGSLKPKSINLENIRTSSVKGAVKKEGIQKGMPAARNRTSFNRNSITTNSVNGSNLQKKTQRAIKPEINGGNGKVRNTEKKSSCEKEPTDTSAGEEETQQEDKENRDDAPVMEEVSVSG